jgi:2-polyprenyl-6-methoxyphenol hydroxylase-like FAD-dependent oxidoreductase
MSRVIVVGAGPVGLASAILFARDGHEVIVLEKDPQAPPATALSAWEKWERSGVAQFRQIHVMQARVRHILDAEFPDVRDDILALGGRRVSVMSGFFNALDNPSPLPGDDKFETITARRPVIESAFARAAENTPGVKVARGVSVQGPIADDRSTDGIPRVVGVKTKEGETYLGDLVVDAMGRKSRIVEWIADLGGRAPYEESLDMGFAYYTRHYRCRDGFEPELRRAPITLLSTCITVSIPTDNETWGVAVIGMAGDKPMKALRHNDVWERVVRSVPHLSQWIEGDPLHDVLPMAGALDRYRRFVVAGEPVVTGMVAVGDAWACTNPTAGRGVSMGLGHAIAIRDVARVHFDDPHGLAMAFDAVTEERFTPWYRQQLDRDHDRVASIQATIEGREVPKADPSNPIKQMQQAFATAAAHDPEVARAFAEVLSVLALPQEIMARPGMLDKVRTAAAGQEPPQTPGPSRAEILALLDSA